MRRLRENKIDDARYYENVWAAEKNARPYYDATRQRALIARARPFDRIVDLGAGVFGAAQYIAENTDLNVELVAVDQSYTARDIVLRMLETTNRKQCFRFDYILSETHHVPFPDGWFDLVIAGELIEHYEDPSQLVAEMARLCRGGGYLSMSTVDTHCEDAIRHGPYPEHIWEFEPEDLVRLFQPYGVTRYYLFGDYHCIEVERHDEAV